MSRGGATVSFFLKNIPIYVQNMFPLNSSTFMTSQVRHEDDTGENQTEITV